MEHSNLFHIISDCIMSYHIISYHIRAVSYYHIYVYFWMFPYFQRRNNTHLFTFFAKLNVINSSHRTYIQHTLPHHRHLWRLYMSPAHCDIPTFFEAAEMAETLEVLTLPRFINSCVLLSGICLQHIYGQHGKSNLICKCTCQYAFGHLHPESQEY